MTDVYLLQFEYDYDDWDGTAIAASFDAAVRAVKESWADAADDGIWGDAEPHWPAAPDPTGETVIPFGRDARWRITRTPILQ